MVSKDDVVKLEETAETTDDDGKDGDWSDGDGEGIASDRLVFLLNYKVQTN